jgi:cytochrome c oxidase assembly protein subunit 15
MVRHSGAGLAITDFPLARGRIIPPMDSFPVAVHFAHRAGALVVTLAALAFIGAIIDARPIGVSPADCGVLAVLIIFQIALGAHIIWLVRPPVTTTLHVVTGAAVLAWSLRMALRVGRQRGLAAALEPRAAITGGAPA